MITLFYNQNAKLDLISKFQDLGTRLSLTIEFVIYNESEIWKCGHRESQVLWFKLKINI